MKLYNTLSRSKEDFTPRDDTTVTLYTCGLTVYNQPHIGNWVAYIYWDVLVRTLTAAGYTVNRVQNITDVGHLTSDADEGDDKLQMRAAQENVTAWDIAEKYIGVAEHEAYELLGLLRPDHMPRATDFISQQIALIQELETRGYTYEIPKSGIYYDTSKWSAYGAMARLDIEGLRAGNRVEMGDKRHPTDFALWKFSHADQQRDMEWDSPWGKGFPGWHIECSAMARDILGEQIDIHTGGIDHIPVHHTNEIAQTEAVTGQPFSSFWVHCNHMKVDGTKISKSLGNGYTLQDLVDKGFDISAFKLMVLSSHYRTEGNFTWDILESNARRWKHWQSVAELRWQTHDTLVDDDEKSTDELTAILTRGKQDIQTALQDDLNTPLVLSIVDDMLSRIEKKTLVEIHQRTLTDVLDFIQSVTGLPVISSTPDISDEQKMMILERSRAREQNDWEKSDTLRKSLHKQGIAVNDGTHSTWYRL